MALIQCPECGNTVSDKAAKCPSCGMPVDKMGTAKPAYDYSQMTMNEALGTNKKAWTPTFGGIVGAIVLGNLAFYFLQGLLDYIFLSL